MTRYAFIMIIGLITIPCLAAQNGTDNDANARKLCRDVYKARLNALAASGQSPIGPLMAIWAIGAGGLDAHPIKEILAIEPGNKPATAIEAQNRVGDVVAQWRDVITYFDRRVKLMRDQGEQQLRLRSHEHRIYDVLTPDMPFVNEVEAYEGDPIRYVTDVNAVRAILMRKVDEKTRAAETFIRAAIERDPTNALYDYLMAQLFLVDGRPERALPAIELGLTKEAVSDYHKEASQMAAKAMDDAGIPMEDRPGDYPVQGLLMGVLWESGISDMVAASVKDGDIDKAKYLCNLMLRVARQCDGPNLLGRAVEKRLKEINARK